MQVYTMGFTKKNAENFFGLIKKKWDRNFDRC